MGTVWSLRAAAKAGLHVTGNRVAGRGEIAILVPLIGNSSGDDAVEYRSLEKESPAARPLQRLRLRPSCKSGQMSGLNVPPLTLKMAEKYLDACETTNGSEPTGGYGYTGPQETPTMSAVGLLCRQYLGTPRRNQALPRKRRAAAVFYYRPAALDIEDESPAFDRDLGADEIALVVLLEVDLGAFRHVRGIDVLAELVVELVGVTAPARGRRGDVTQPLHAAGRHTLEAHRPPA